MLVEIKKLNIENQGYKRIISLDKMYVNTDSVVSIVDYEGANPFLLKEQSKLSTEKFSLIKLDEGGSSREIIAYGTAAQLYATFSGSNTGKQLLNE